MSDAWDGRPQNPERAGWHWLQDRSDFRSAHPRRWSAADEWGRLTVREAGLWYYYLGPCLTPAEVAAREAQARREGMEAGFAAGCDQGSDEATSFEWGTCPAQSRDEALRALAEDQR